MAYEITSDLKFGRYLIASKSIAKGEIIMRMPPLILAPKMASVPICLACHQKLDENSFIYCTECKWPLCSQKCKEIKLWHKKECEIFAKHNFHPAINFDQARQSVYSVIAPLRVLLLKQEKSEKFQDFLQCESHYDQRKSTQIYKILSMNLVPLFINRFQLATNEQEILEICSILDTNTFEVRNSPGTINIRGFYPTISLLTHDCKHNTEHFFDGKNFTLNLRATRGIDKGEMITTTYTQTLWCTLSRRSHLKQSKLFDCQCDRCKDPTEFGTYIGSILCPNCDDSKMISCNPLDYDADWKCEQCDNVIDGAEIAWGNDVLKQEIANLDKSHPEFLEAFLTNYSHVLHPKNTFCLQVKYALCQMYGNVSGFGLEELTTELLDRKIELCNELLEIAAVLEEEYSRFRGLLLQDKQLAILEKARRSRDNNEISREIFQATLHKASIRAKDCSQIVPDILTNKIANLQTNI